MNFELLPVWSYGKADVPQEIMAWTYGPAYGSKELCEAVRDGTVSQYIERCQEDRKMARKPRQTKAEKEAAGSPQIENPLLSALKFIMSAVTRKGDGYAEHVSVGNNAMIGFDGVTAAGIRINNPITATPHTAQLRKAMDHAGSSFTVVATDQELQVQSDKLSVKVPCMADPTQFPAVFPDAGNYPLSNAVREALACVGALVSDKGDTALTSSILMRNGSCVSTDRVVMIEMHHGQAMPDLVVPKSFAAAIGREDKEIKSFGFSDKTLTIFFSDDSFVRTNLFQSPPDAPIWPADWEAIMPTTHLDNSFDLSASFWGAFDHAAAFADSYVVLTDDGCHSDTGTAHGKFKLPEGTKLRLPVKQSKLLRKYALTFGRIPNTYNAGFFGDRTRGAVYLPDEAPSEEVQPEADAPSNGWTTNVSPTDPNIPF